METKGMDCDIVNSNDGRKVCSIRVSVVPRQGEVIDLDVDDHQSGSELIRVVEVRYHVRPRKLAGVRWAFRTDDLVGVSLYVTPASATLPPG